MPSISRSLVLVYGANGANGLLSALTIPTAVGLLGFSGYGLFSIYTFLSACILMGDLGIGKNLLRHLASSRESPVETLRAAFTLYLVVAATWLALSPFVAEVVSHYIFAVPSEHVIQLKWLTFLAFVEFAVGIPVSLLQTSAVAAQRFDAYARFSLVAGVAKNFAIICAAYAFGTPVAIAAVLVAKRMADVFLAAHFFGPLPVTVWKPRLDLNAFRTMLGQSTQLSIATVLNAAIGGIASALVNASFGLSGLGVYRSAADLAAKVAFLSNGLSLVAFPNASVRSGAGSRTVMTDSAASDLISFSTVAYACVAAISVLLAPVLFPLAGLQSPTVIGLFCLLIIGLSINAHSVLSNEFVQASGRYRLSICFNVVTVVGLVLSFQAFKASLGAFAIGWAWVLAAVAGAGVIDACLLSLCKAGFAQHGKSVLVKLLSTVACLGVAASQLGIAGRPVAFSCAALLMGMLLLCSWRFLPHMLRIVRTDSRPVEAAGTYA
ncbi:MAG: hypothetical protein IT168_11610 [Bryobacterales bacterium]|nr:hypothetical protein [Bryobacterales bacterium]